MSTLILQIPAWLLPGLLLAVSIMALAIIVEKGYLLYFKLKDDSIRDVLARIASEAGADREREKRRFGAYLSARLPLLGTISTVSPLIGLLGTVTGMIKSFHAFEAGGAGGLEQPLLLGGIDEALITTCFGLIIAIPALIAYNSYAARVNAILDELDFAAGRIDGADGSAP